MYDAEQRHPARLDIVEVCVRMVVADDRSPVTLEGRRLFLGEPAMDILIEQVHMRIDERVSP